MYFPVTFPSLNWIDLIALIIIIVVSFEGWNAGLVNLFLSFVAYFVSAIVSLKSYTFIAEVASGYIKISQIWLNILALIITAIVSQIFITWAILKLAEKLVFPKIPRRVDNIGGLFFGLINGILLVFFITIIFLNIPFNQSLSRDISHSYISFLINKIASSATSYISIPVGKLNNTILEFITVSPGSREKILLEVRPGNWQLIPDEEEEKLMIVLLNQERVKIGLMPLDLDPKLVNVARAHSLDMFNRKYFSHFDPDNHDITYRLNKASISYKSAGENLAYAPDVHTAFAGLLKSQTHRDNMLDPGFEKIGIGIIDGSIFGKIYTQIMTN